MVEGERNLLQYFRSRIWASAYAPCLTRGFRHIFYDFSLSRFRFLSFALFVGDLDVILARSCQDEMTWIRIGSSQVLVVFLEETTDTPRANRTFPNASLILSLKTLHFTV